MHKYLMKGTWYKIIFGLIKKIFIGLLTGIVSESNHARVQPTLINLNPNEYIQEFHYYWFVVKLDRCVASCNTLNYLFIKVCVAYNTKDLNLSVFNMVIGINKKY